MVQYVAKNCHKIAEPLGILSKLQGGKPWRWGPTEQRAFEDVKRIVTAWRNNHRVSLDRSEKADPIGVSVDASKTGAGGVIWQGPSVEKARIIAFWSGKFNSAEQNYPVHERELLGIVSTLKKYTHILYGTKFTVYTDHKPLEHFLRQKSLSPRQRRWLDFLSQFNFEISYVKGTANSIADALSRVYSDEPAGTIRAPSEYVTDPGNPSRNAAILDIIQGKLPKSVPLYTGKHVSVPLKLFAITRRQAADVQSAAVGEEVLKLTEKSVIAPSESEVDSDDGESEAELPPIASSQPPPTSAKISSSAGTSAHVDPPEESMDSPDPDTAISNPSDDNSSRSIENSPILTETLPPAIPVKDDQERLEEALAPSLTYVVAEGEPEIRFPECLKERYSEDTFFGPIVAKPTEFKHYSLENGLLFLKDNGRRLLCIPDVKIGERKVREICITHAHSILAHLGAKKTMQYLRDNVWWHEMQRDVTDYCKSCTNCAHSKTDTQRPYGLLRPLEVPNRPWQAIGIDFVGPLPSSSNRNGFYDMIAVIIDHLSAMVHLLPMRQNFKAKEVAELIFEGVYKLHGLPERIVSDRDSYFTSTFWSELHKLIGVELRLSTAFHPQTDGATERANRTINTMLRQAVAPHQKDWVAKLPGIEFALNSARSETTGYSPFFLNYGQMPRPLIWDANSDYPGVRLHAERIRQAVMSAHDSILSARVKQTTSANKARRPAPFAEGDLVYLSTKNLSIPKRRARKLVPKFIGPFVSLR